MGKGRWFMRDQHISPAEAAESALASHYGTFQLTDEAIDESEERRIDALRAAGIPPERFRALQPEQVWHRADSRQS